MKEHVEIKMDDLIMRGIENINGEDKCVVMFHGFTGNKTETNRIFYNLEKKLQEEGISSIRFDWFGHGESDLDLSLLSMDLLLKQAAKILDYAKSKFRVVYLLGFSMGGAIAINSLSFSPEKLVLISPATNMVDITTSIFNTREKIEEKYVDLNGSKLSREFVDSCKQLEYKKNLKAYNNPVLLIHGTNDLAVPIVNSRDLNDYINNGKFLEIEGADHGYNKVEFMSSIFHEVINFLK
ncbi:MAG: alpha/beta fold hydrolase [Tenericutes bacterium]|jgi:esterase/lipase|nr:alpha/beta fold hydrolase [Mycoplasmatota bacterium]